MSNSFLRCFKEHEEYTEARIQRGIDENRKGIGKIQVVNAEGEYVANVDVQVEQLNHAFKFGCNIFMLDGYEDDKSNARYKDAFKDLFNLAIVPFYWATLEPEHGKLRFAKDSERIFRRPAPDAVLEYCAENGIEPKGHPLMWHEIYPDWLPRDRELVKPYIDKRLKEIAELYADRIPVWDVVNEPIASPYASGVVLPDDYVYWTFKKAERYFGCNRLFINELTGTAWDTVGELNAYHLLIQNLLLRRVALDGIGLQYHLFYTKEQMDKVTLLYLNPEKLFKALDNYNRYNLPLHVSEVTVPAYSYGADDEEVHAELIRRLYRLWFSHPLVEAIVYWNLNDGRAYGSEGRFMGGLLREDLTSKPAYDIISELIHKEWHTELHLRNADGRETRFEGFYGDYRLTVKGENHETVKTIHLSKTSRNLFRIVL